MTKEEKLQEIRNKVFEIRYKDYDVTSDEMNDYSLGRTEENKRKHQELYDEEVSRMQDYESLMYDVNPVLQNNDYSWITR